MLLYLTTLTFVFITKLTCLSSTSNLTIYFRSVSHLVPSYLTLLSNYTFHLYFTLHSFIIIYIDLIQGIYSQTQLQLNREDIGNWQIAAILFQNRTCS